MSDRSEPSPVVTVDPFTIVPANDAETTDYWLIRNGTDRFPLRLDELHDLMDAIDEFHDTAHPH